jgi:hypothetical protein
MSKLRVIYTVGCLPRMWLVMFAKNQQVGDFLKLVRTKQERDDFVPFSSMEMSSTMTTCLMNGSNRRGFSW